MREREGRGVCLCLCKGKMGGRRRVTSRPARASLYRLRAYIMKLGCFFGVRARGLHELTSSVGAGYISCSILAGSLNCVM